MAGKGRKRRRGEKGRHVEKGREGIGVQGQARRAMEGMGRKGRVVREWGGREGGGGGQGGPTMKQRG